MEKQVDADLNQGSVLVPVSIVDEVETIFELLNNYQKKLPRESKLKRSWSERWVNPAVYSFIAAVLIVGILLYIFPPNTWNVTEGNVRLALQILVLLLYVFGGAVLVLQYLSIKSYFRDFTGDLLKVLGSSAKNEVALFEQLEPLSAQSIEYVAKRLDTASTQLGALRSFFIGAVEKIGIIPGVIATAVALSKIPQSAGISWLEPLSIMMLGIYGVAFPITTAKFRFRKYAFILNRYLESSNKSTESPQAEKCTG